MYRPLKITAHIHGPVAFNRAEGIAIDSPLAWAAAVQRLGEAFYDRSPDNDELARISATPDPDIPLAVHEAGGLWCYAASLAQIDGDHGTEVTHWNKRFDQKLAGYALEAGLLSEKRLKVNLGSSEFKSYHQPLYEEVVERLVWHVIGDPDRLRAMLPRIRGLGKKRNTGHGRVLKWDVEPHDGPDDAWMWRDEQPSRAIPLVMLDDWQGETMWAGFRPPYWLPSNQAECAVPEAVSIDA